MARFGKVYLLRKLWADLNAEHFSSALQPVPLRVTRSRRTYGYYNAPNPGGQPSIRISWALATAEPHTLRDTMAHEMIHQFLHADNWPEWDLHGMRFQNEHVRIFGYEYVEPA